MERRIASEVLTLSSEDDNLEMIWRLFVVERQAGELRSYSRCVGGLKKSDGES